MGCLFDEQIAPEKFAQIAPETFAYVSCNGIVYEYLQRPDGLWGWRRVDTKEWCE